MPYVTSNPKVDQTCNHVQYVHPPSLGDGSRPASVPRSLWPFLRAVITDHRLIVASHEAALPVKVGSPKIFSAYGLDRKKFLGGLDRQADRDKSPVGPWLIAALPLRLRAVARSRHRRGRFRPAGRGRTRPTPGARAGRLGGRRRAPLAPEPLSGQFSGFAKYKRFLRNAFVDLTAFRKKWI